MASPDGEDLLWRPVRAGMCRFESFLDGTFSLADAVDMNLVLDIERENELRVEAARQQE